ncbi:MAG: division/cell wall cluster transcriptional repressor MraZ [Armatimonadota bacterium]|nr:MAG: division/cell wall cluster transcriptional repressor MraZ [Armatimonadota bacterium]
MLTGEVGHQLDDRGRVAIPKSFRDVLEHGGFITRGWYGCLFLFPWEEWRKIEDRLNEVRITDTNGDIVKQFFSGGSKVFLDRQGRMVLPAALREYAGIEAEVVVRGVINRIEIWAKSRWLSFQSEQFSPERIMDKTAALGI